MPMNNTPRSHYEQNPGAAGIFVRTTYYTDSVKNCTTCSQLGDEYHTLFHCSEICRDDLLDMPNDFSSIWNYEGVNRLFQRIRDAEYVE